MGYKQKSTNLYIFVEPVGIVIQITNSEGETSTYVKREGSTSIERVRDE